MSLQYIFNQVASEAGITSPDLNVEQSNLLKDKINKAAKEIYDAIDLPGVLREVYVKVTNGQTLTLPGFVGKVRAMRSQRWNDIWTMRDLRPRYHYADWDNKWTKIRVIGEFPINQEILNAGPFSYETSVADSSIIVSTVGETTASNRVLDTVTMDATTKNGTKSFTEVRSIEKNKITDNNITIKDAAGVEIAILYADQLKSRYLVIDISEFPNIQDCSDGTFVMEVLYKPRLNILQRDSDCFPVDGYDDIIALRTKQLLAEDKPGEESRALLMNSKSKEQLMEQVEDNTGTVEKVLFTEPHPLYNLFPKYN